MSLADRVTERPTTIHGSDCSVAVLLNSLEGDELAAFEKIMYGRPGLRETTRGYRGWSEREVFAAIEAEGYAVAQSQINVHRGKKCRCYPKKTS